MDELTELERFGIGVAISFRITYLQEMIKKSLHLNDSPNNPLAGLNEDLKAIYETRIKVLQSAAAKMGIIL